MTNRNVNGNTEAGTPQQKKGPRFYLGMLFLLLSLISPAFVPLVANLPVSTAVKGVITTLLLIGVPEIMVVIAVALLGKETFYYFIDRIKSFFRIKKPVKPVGRTRYTIGLIMLIGTIVASVIEVNYPPARDIYGEYFTEAAIAWNAIFILSLFVLGGNFWEKLRALFIYDAYAVIPRNEEECLENGRK